MRIRGLHHRRVQGDTRAYLVNSRQRRERPLPAEADVWS